MENIVIPYITGDGVGKEITPAMIKVVDAAVAKAYDGEKSISWLSLLAGEEAFRQTGSWLPEETIEAFRKYGIGIKGPMTTPVGEGIRSLNVQLRQTLDLYVCMRPVKYYQGIESPVKHPEKVNMFIFRENTEDIYAGIEWAQGTAEAARLFKFLNEEMGVRKVRFPETSAFGIKPVSEEGSKRLVRAAIDFALANGLKTVTLVHKGNIMKYTEGGFKKWGYELAREEYAEELESGRLVVNDCIADAFLQNALLYPERYQVIATLNLNGDYISDMLAAQVGGIGIAPGANINYANHTGIFEATHGTAPDIAGKDLVNPGSIILSAVMMLDFIGFDKAARLLDEAVAEAFTKLGGDLRCSIVTENILDSIEKR